jgi:putative heme-binding domain-containing protein
MRRRYVTLVGLARAIVVTANTLLLVTDIAAIQDEQENRAHYFRYAIEHDGDAENGTQLFQNHAKLLCADCHNVTGLEKSGPNLEGIADKFNREELIRQILYPSESIKPGFEEAIIVTTDGLTHVGRLERANRTECRIIDATGRQTTVPIENIESRQVSNVSLMPDNVASTISPEEFADLIAYLRTLTFGVHRGLVSGGREIEISRLPTPVTFQAIHPAELSFENPVWCSALPSTANDLVVVEHHTAKVWRLIREGEQPRKELFADLSGDTYISANQGLLCIAFHPDYASNHRYFLKHEIEEGSEVKSVIVERRASSDGLRDIGEKSRRLLETFQPAFNHNGGCLAFGPDGMLYTAFGDGGPQLDPNGYSQNPRDYLGSMVRIDVDRSEGGRPYAIPDDNPFLDAFQRDPTICPETWAIGFREPWRFSFDAKTGELYVGDVGQDKFEEVSLVKRGENHGWNVREAFAPFSDEYRRSDETYTDPIFAYEHGLGFSVTGGYVYRGKSNPSFDGVYIFGDYSTRRVWGLRQHDGVVAKVVEIGTAPASIVSFGVDQANEIYLVTYMGTIYHVDLAGTVFP